MDAAEDGERTPLLCHVTGDRADDGSVAIGEGSRTQHATADHFRPAMRTVAEQLTHFDRLRGSQRHEGPNDAPSPGTSRWLRLAKFRRSVAKVSEQIREKKRVIKHGTLQARRKGHQKKYIDDFYFHMVRMRWPFLLLILLGIYVTMALVFASLYYIDRHGFDPDPRTFMEMFFHSMAILLDLESPYEPASHEEGLRFTAFVWIVYISEGFVSAIAGALLIGLLVDRLQTPSPRMLFSKNAIITTLDGQRCFMFRVANERDNQLVECECNAWIMQEHKSTEGHCLRRDVPLPLENGSRPVFHASWLLIHVISEHSPLYACSPNDGGEIPCVWVKVRGEDSTFEKTFHALQMYQPSNIVWGGQFVDVVSAGYDGILEVDLRHFHDVVVEGERTTL